jgi:hypothetical protein
VQRFSISTLTAVALMDGIVESLVQRYLHLATLKIKAAASVFNYSSSTSLIARENRRRRRKGSHDIELAAPSNMKMGSKRNGKKYLKKAERDSDGIRCDIQALVGITDVSFSFEILVFLFLSSWWVFFEGPAVCLSELVFETPLIDSSDASRSLLKGRRQLVWIISVKFIISASLPCFFLLFSWLDGFFCRKFYYYHVEGDAKNSDLDFKLAY